MNISKYLLILIFFSGAPLYSSTLEFSEFTVRGDSPATGLLTTDQEALFDKGLVAFNQRLSLPIPPRGKISYRDTKAVPYGTKYDEKGIPKELRSRDAGVTFTAHVKKKEGQYEISFDYNRTSLVCNITKATPHGEILYLPEFQINGVQSTMSLYPNQWFIQPCLNPKSKENIVVALKVVE